MLIRFDGSSIRGPSASLFHGLVDWVRGSLAAALGNGDWDDFSPHNAGNETIAGTTGAAASLNNDRDGVVGEVNLTADAGANAEAAAIRNVVTQLNKITVCAFEVRAVRNDSADTQFTAIGLTDQTGANVLASNALAVGGGQDFVGIEWVDDGDMSIVAVVNGTRTVLKADFATVAMGSATGYTEVGMRIEKVTSATYRLTPCVNGVIIRSGAVSVDTASLPTTVALRPVVVIGTSANTAPSLDRDWTLFIDK